MKRSTKLLEAAAATFEDSGDPFNTEWLSKHKVTSQECYELSQQIACAVKNWARLEGNDIAEAAVRASVDDRSQRIALLSHYRRQVAMGETVKRLGELSKRVSAGITSAAPHSGAGAAKEATNDER